MNRCAVTLHAGRSRNSYASPSVRLFTAAFVALYAGLPLSFRVYSVGTCKLKRG